MLMNVLACRVYRKTRLGLYQESQDTLISNAAKNLKYVTANDRSRDSGVPVMHSCNGRPRSEANEGIRSFWVDEGRMESNRYGRSINQGDMIPLTMV